MTPTTTTDATPTNAQLWQALRVLFGTKLEAATLVVLTRGNDDSLHLCTCVFPPKEK